MFLRKLLYTDLRACHRIFNRGLANASWDVVTGVCVERLPVVTPPLNEIQKKYKDMLSAIEIEQSLKSDHELRHEADKIHAELLKNEAVDVDPDAASKITAQDFEDAANEEYAKFKLADIVTEADKTGDKTTLDRCLQRHLVLVTKHKLGKDEKHLLPQGLWKEGETLRQTAERVVSEHCGKDFNVQFLSNAPCGFYKYKYPSEINGKVGAKLTLKKMSKENACKCLWVADPTYPQVACVLVCLLYAIHLFILVLACDSVRVKVAIANPVEAIKFISNIKDAVTQKCVTPQLFSNKISTHDDSTEG